MAAQPRYDPKGGGSSRWQSASRPGEFGEPGSLAENAADFLHRGAYQIRELTRDREGSAVLVAMAAGFGLGLVIGGTLGSTQSRRPQRWTDQWSAEAEKLSRRMLEQFERLLPEALAERLPNR